MLGRLAACLRFGLSMVTEVVTFGPPPGSVTLGGGGLFFVGGCEGVGYGFAFFVIAFGGPVVGGPGVDFVFGGERCAGLDEEDDLGEVGAFGGLHERCDPVGIGGIGGCAAFEEEVEDFGGGIAGGGGVEGGLAALVGVGDVGAGVEECGDFVERAGTRGGHEGGLAPFVGGVDIGTCTEEGADGADFAAVCGPHEGGASVGGA